MSLTISQSTTPDFKPVEAGTHAAVISAIIDHGTQETTWKGTTKNRHQVRLQFSFPDMPLQDGRCMSISKTYTASLHENSGFRAHLEGIRGRKFTDAELAGFDLGKALGAPCLINVIHEPSEFGPRAKIASVMSLPRSMPKPEFSGPLLAFDLSKPNDDIFEQLPEWQREIIEKSPEWQSYVNGPGDTPDQGGEEFPFDDDIGF